ncbi:MAG: hypothetical protein ACO29O_01830 [Chitinophagaceae bacterium]
MQRAEVLLQKLNEQILSKASASHILVTLQLLQREFLQKAETEIPIDSTVSIVLPYTMRDPSPDTDPDIDDLNKMGNDQFSSDRSNHFSEMVIDISIDSAPINPSQNFTEQRTQIEEQQITEVLMEINDQLKAASNDVVEILSDVPIKELKKSIGINDRYLYINELFKGDEAMFDRSLKTLDQFEFLHEAESWIRRELSVKNGWKEDNPVVRQFGQLLKRRFS